MSEIAQFENYRIEGLKYQGNGIMRRARRAYAEDVLAGLHRKKAAKNAAIYTLIFAGPCIAAAVLTTLALNHWKMHSSTIAAGIVGGAIGIFTGAAHAGKRLIQAIKTKRQTSREFKNIVNSEDFMAIVNKLFKRSEENKMTSKDFMKWLEENTKVKVIKNADNYAALDKLAMEDPLKAAAKKSQNKF